MQPISDIVMTIRLTQEGQMFVDGPVQDKILIFGILETAKMIVSRTPQPKEQMIVPVKGKLVDKN